MFRIICGMLVRGTFIFWCHFKLIENSEKECSLFTMGQGRKRSDWFSGLWVITSDKRNKLMNFSDIIH